MDIIDLFPIPITKVENCLSDVQRKKIFMNVDLKLLI